jgi:hypothetical protein
MTFPIAVILNRLAKDFLVLIPFGRRINLLSVSLQKSAQYMERRVSGKLYFPGNGLSRVQAQ